MEATPRYTVKQVLEVLRRIAPYHADYPMDRFRAVQLWDYAEDPLRRSYRQLFSMLEDMWCVGATEDEWQALADNDEITVLQLAEFISQRAPLCEIRPLRILGRDCLEAGIFREVAAAAIRITGTSTEVGPSTALKDALDKRQLERLKNRLWLYFPSIHSIPRLLHESVWQTLGAIGALAVFGLTFLSLFTHVGTDSLLRQVLFSIGAISAAFALWLLPLWILVLILGWVLNRNRGPFRDEIQTFRDLVMALRGAELARFST